MLKWMGKKIFTILSYKNMYILTYDFYRCENAAENRKFYGQAYLHGWKMDQLRALKSNCDQSKCL